MDRKELIKKYIEFFKSKGHKEIMNSSLVPENDPSVLFTTAGMHPLVPFLLGQKHPSGRRLVNVQKCVRTGDIDEVGDGVHHTFFEMLGNWSLGDYFKKEAINWSFEFLTKILRIPKEEISVTCFAGDENAKKDNEAAEIWIKLGIQKINFCGKEDNWWETAGAGPCGPDTEMFVNGVEIWNDVFMQYVKDEKGSYNPAKQKNVDTGMGIERTIAVLSGLDDNYMTGCFLPIIKKIEEISGKDYKGSEKEMRIIADHLKAAVFIVGDGVVPSNNERGYVLRRLIRRAVRYGRVLGMSRFTKKIAEPVFRIYDDYPNLKNKEKILEELENEEGRFLETLEKGMNIFEKKAKDKTELSGRDAFLLFQSYGFPLEMTIELAKEKNIKVDEAGFKKEFEKHQELSRTSSAGQFKSGLADNSVQTTKLHTATHLLAQALREVLNKKDLHQKGSNITPERLRFDFNFDRKLADKEIKDIEKLVNKKIQEHLPVKKEEMSVEQAKKIAESVFEHKYSEKVFVYSIGNFSKEICAGPHVSNTKELGKFRIIKEEAVAAGIRRIKAVLES